MNPHPASYRDPSGFVFWHNGSLYRQVNRVYAAHYDLLMSSGLYSHLTKNKWLISHSESNENISASADWYKTLLPEMVFPITYAYEWCFGQLRDAALHTLRVLRTALDHGMILKDATPFNIQFVKGKPIFIDTLSFEKYDPAKPWIAYRQFCECFLYPLYLHHYLRVDALKLLSIYIDGIPADVMANLLPARSRLNLNTWLHVFLLQSVRNTHRSNASVPFNKTKLLRIVTHLQSVITGLSPGKLPGHWSNYYTETITSQEYLGEKEKLFREFCDAIPYQSALDVGANDGFFSKIAATENKTVIAIDSDATCISRLYNHVSIERIDHIVPLVVDAGNPTPALGFNGERSAFMSRVKVDLVIALAVVHHLAIGRNIPLSLLVKFFSDIASYGIVEFVPKQDPKVQQLLAGREDVFPNYSAENFEEQLLVHFTILKKAVIPGSERILYCLARNNT